MVGGKGVGIDGAVGEEANLRGAASRACPGRASAIWRSHQRRSCTERSAGRRRTAGARPRLPWCRCAGGQGPGPGAGRPGPAEAGSIHGPAAASCWRCGRFPSRCSGARQRHFTNQTGRHQHLKGLAHQILGIGRRHAGVGGERAHSCSRVTGTSQETDSTTAAVVSLMRWVSPDNGLKATQCSPSCSMSVPPASK